MSTAMEPRSSVVIDVQGMHCDSCIQLIESTLSDEPGIISIKVSRIQDRMEFWHYISKSR